MDAKKAGADCSWQPGGPAPGSVAAVAKNGNRRGLISAERSGGSAVAAWLWLALRPGETAVSACRKLLAKLLVRRILETF